MPSTNRQILDTIVARVVAVKLAHPSSAHKIKVNPKGAKSDVAKYLNDIKNKGRDNPSKEEVDALNATCNGMGYFTALHLDEIGAAPKF